MSLGTFVLGAVVTFIIMSGCFGGFCDQGPPGRFCTKDLSGYHYCFVNKKTSKIEHVIKKCPEGTRCKCMGIPCFTPYPCGHYKLPPVMPDSYHTEYNEQKTVCSRFRGCQKTYSRVAFWRDARNSRYQEEHTVSNHDPPYWYIIIVPYGRSLMRYEVVPSKQTCTKRIVRHLPPKIQVPTKFSFYNYRYVYGDYCQRWIWAEGGRKPTQPINVETWDTAHTVDRKPKVVQYKAYFRGDRFSRKSTRIERYYSVFTTDPSSGGYAHQVPRYCNS